MMAFWLVVFAGILTHGEDYFHEYEKTTPEMRMFVPDLSLSSVRILTLNLFLRPPLVKTNESDFKDLRTNFFISHFLENYDILCLQEVFGFMNYRKQLLIEEARRAGFYYHAESPAPTSFSGYLIDGGLLVLSRLPIVEWHFQPYRDSAMPDSLSQKGILYCKIKTKSEYVHIFTSHMQSSYPVTDPALHILYRETRRLQFQDIREYVFKHAHEGDFALLLGDLNVDSREAYKPPLFPEVPTDDYEVMMEILGEDAVDWGLNTYGFHPVTFGKKREDGSPDETVLSDVREQGGEYSLDYIIQMSQSQQISVVEGSTKVAEFYVQGQPFTQISDHFGLETTLAISS